MNVEEALKIADEAIFASTGKYLTDVQQSIFEGSWNKQTYDEIASKTSYTGQHVKNEGSAFWKLLSDSLGEKVTKNNFKAALERKISNSTPTPLPEPSTEQETVFNEECDQQEDDIDVLVAEVRSHFQRELNEQCKSLELFDLFYNPLEVHLDKIYVDPNLNELKPFGAMGETQLWKQVVLENTNLIVLGCPGAGKTTLLKHIATNLYELNFPTQLIPIFIKLNSVHKIVDFESQSDFITFAIKKQYTKQYVSEDKLKLLLSQGRFILLLDGLDEVPQKYIDKIIEGIDLFKSSDYQENKLVISCRKEYEAYQSAKFTKFKKFQVKEFDLQSQIPQFVENWFNNASLLLQNDLSGKADILIDKIENSDRLQDIASTPLLLHLMCLVFLEKDDLPSKRSELYDEAINLMLKKWNKFKGCNHQTLSDSEIDLVRKTLRQIAAITFEQDRLDFEEPEVRDLLKDCPLSLSEIQVQSGLIVKQSWRKYAFHHKTFQEYLTAESIVNSCNPYSMEDKRLNNLASHITNKRWREVFLLVTEIISNADCFLRMIKRERDQQDELFQELLKCIHNRKLTDKTYKSPLENKKINFISFGHSTTALLLECLNSDCCVSPEVREEIEETLLLPIDEIEKWKQQHRPNN
ncbi:MAG: NACHT domain-containing protein [Limnoraphis sp. WC205]|nr:NACHT domain-containing protein [Limnoraphis sp. WC205]